MDSNIMYVIQNDKTKKYMKLNSGYLSLSNKFTANLNEAKLYRKFSYAMAQANHWAKYKPNVELTIESVILTINI